jgi:cyclopropane-fatty-acyl-phospholipid synthase
MFRRNDWHAESVVSPSLGVRADARVWWEDAVLKRLFARYIKIGRLTVRGLARDPVSFGTPSAEYPHLDVAITVKGWWTAWKIALRPDLAGGEAYMDGTLTIDRGDVRDFLELFFINLRGPGSQAPTNSAARCWRQIRRALHHRNTRLRSRRHVAHHYDLSEAFYRQFLDPDMQYSCAYFEPGTTSLEAAQQAKKRHILNKLLLRPGQRVLDIGCGWGGLALTLARQGAGRVTGITLSKEQLSVARRRAAEGKLDGRVGFELKDYRDLAGPFDRVVSVGMFEHVGTAHYPEFFAALSRLMADDGVTLLHSIGRMDEPGLTNAWIRKYIFPGGYVPALSEVLATIERAGLWVTDIEILRLHYAETVHHWWRRFQQRRAEIAESYDERFCRMWEFYLAVSEMGFRHDGLMVFQLQLAKRIDAVPVTRDYMQGQAAAQDWTMAARAG